MDALPRGRNIRVKELQMRKLFYFTSVLLITAGMSFAQTGSGSGSGSTAGGGAGASGTGSTSGDTTGGAASTSGSPSADQGAAAGSSTGSQSGSSATSTGSSADQTTISGCISKSGDNFVLTDANGTAYKLDGSGLDAHVGHQASLTGSMGSDNKFKVSDMKMISESCSTTGAAAAAPSGAAASASTSNSTLPSSPNSTAPVTDS